MLWTMLLLDLVPLIVFTILDAFGNMRYALIGAVLAAILNLTLLLREKPALL